MAPWSWVSELLWHMAGVCVYSTESPVNSFLFACWDWVIKLTKQLWRIRQKKAVRFIYLSPISCLSVSPTTLAIYSIYCDVCTQPAITFTLLPFQSPFLRRTTVLLSLVLFDVGLKTENPPLACCHCLFPSKLTSIIYLFRRSLGSLIARPSKIALCLTHGSLVCSITTSYSATAQARVIDREGRRNHPLCLQPPPLCCCRPPVCIFSFPQSTFGVSPSICPLLKVGK